MKTKTPNKTSQDSEGTAVSHVVSGVNYIVSNDHNGTRPLLRSVRSINKR